MLDAFFSALGSIFASGPGILLLTGLGALLVLVWDWRLTLAGVFVLHLATAAMLVHLHGVTSGLATGQVLAVTMAVLMLGGVSLAHGVGATVGQSGNWVVRSFALAFLIGTWWFVDPGFTLPRFSQPETDYAIWIGLCGLLVLCLSDSPLFVASALLMLSIPSFMFAGVLLPGSGLSALIGIAVILWALACSYLILTGQPAGSPGGAGRRRWLSLLDRLVGDDGGTPDVNAPPPVTLPSTASAARDKETMMEKVA